MAECSGYAPKVLTPRFVPEVILTEVSIFSITGNLTTPSTNPTIPPTKPMAKPIMVSVREFATNST